MRAIATTETPGPHSRFPEAAYGVFQLRERNSSIVVLITHIYGSFVRAFYVYLPDRTSGPRETILIG